MKKVNYTKSIILRHCINWAVVAFLINFVFQFPFPMPVIILRVILAVLIFIFTYYYLIAKVCPNLKINKIKYMISVIICLVLYYLLYFIIEFGFTYVYYNIDISSPEINWLVQAAIQYILIFLLAQSFYVHQIAIQDMQIESLKNQSFLSQEIFFLENQFNEKLSFQLLNFCSNLFKGYDQNGTKAITIYSEMIKNTLTVKSSETISLAQEIIYIKQFIEMQQLVGKNILVKIEKKGDFSTLNILPRILINFIENAFKYSDDGDECKPITISFVRIKNSLNFKITNFKRQHATNLKSTKIGNTNALKQLNLYYPNQYVINIQESDSQYICDLTLQLKVK